MDTIVIAFKAAMGIPLVRILFFAWCIFFLFICVLSIASATVPSRKLYKAGSDGAKKAPLSAIKKSYKESPEKWLLYEEEIFYVKDPDELEGEDLEAYERARVRCVDGGKDARQVGSRIRVRRGEAQAYLRFFYGLHKERKPKSTAPLPRRRVKREEPEEELSTAEPEELEELAAETDAEDAEETETAEDAAQAEEPEEFEADEEGLEGDEEAVAYENAEEFEETEDTLILEENEQEE